MPRNTVFVLGIAFCIGAGQPLVAQDEDPAAGTYELRYRFSPGQELQYRITDQRRVDVQVADKKDVVRYSSDTLRRHNVEVVGEDTNARIEITIQQVRMTAESGGELIEFNSDVDAAPPDVFQGVKQTIGHPLGVVTVSPRGTVVDTELLIGGNLEEFESAQGDLLPILPETPVAVGDTWRDPFEVDILVAADQPLKKRIKLERVYSLESVADGIATIAVRTVVLSPVRDGFQQGQLISRTTNGTVQLDIERGLLLDRSVTLENTVIGFQGPRTSLSIQMSHRDALVPATDPTNDDSTASATP